MSQPPGSPSEDWKPRTDAGARKLIDRIDGMRADLIEGVESKLDERLRSHVTWPGIAGSFVALLALVATLVFTLTAPLKDAIAEVRKEARETAKDTASEVRELRKDMGASREKQDAAIQAIKDVVVEGRPRPTVQRELERKTKEK